MQCRISYNYLLETIDPETKETILGVIESTSGASCVGTGNDDTNVHYSNVRVSDIKRIKNPKLFVPYCKRRTEISKEMSKPHALHVDIFPQPLWKFNYGKRHTDVNEVYLFHGTTEHAAKVIMKEGFDPEVTNPTARFGGGIYFKDRSSKTDQCTGQPDDEDTKDKKLTLLLCRVVLGNVFSCHEEEARKWTCPLCVDCNKEERVRRMEKCHSVVVEGHEPSSRDFVVYDRRQCFPEFIITFKGINKPSPTAVSSPRTAQRKRKRGKTPPRCQGDSTASDVGPTDLNSTSTRRRKDFTDHCLQM